MRDALDEELASISQQGSPNWFDQRIGRFTASQIHRLIKSGTRLMTDEELKARPKSGPGSSAKTTEDHSKFSDDGETYIYEKVAETLTGQIKVGGGSFATSHGEEMEPIAAAYFAEKTGFKYEFVAFVPAGDHTGGSPDGYINEDEILEIKCPYDSTNQVKYLMLTDQYDLKRMYPAFYWQCMSNLLFTGRKLCHFVTYDHRFNDEKHKMAWIKIEPHGADMDLITTKIAAAVKMKLEIIKTLNA